MAARGSSLCSLRALASGKSFVSALLGDVPPSSTPFPKTQGPMHRRSRGWWESGNEDVIAKRFARKIGWIMCVRNLERHKGESAREVTCTSMRSEVAVSPAWSHWRTPVQHDTELARFLGASSAALNSPDRPNAHRSFATTFPETWSPRATRIRKRGGNLIAQSQDAMVHSLRTWNAKSRSQPHSTIEN